MPFSFTVIGPPINDPHAYVIEIETQTNTSVNIAEVYPLVGRANVTGPEIKQRNENAAYIVDALNAYENAALATTQAPPPAAVSPSPNPGAVPPVASTDSRNELRDLTTVLAAIKKINLNSPTAEDLQNLQNTAITISQKYGL